MAELHDDAPIEELTPGEEAASFTELAAVARERKQALDRMPDGPRPRDPAGHRRRKRFVGWHLQINYAAVYLTTATLLAIGFISLNYVFVSLYQRAKVIQELRPFEQGTDVMLLCTLNLVFVLLLIIGAAVFAIVQSHRVAGPALRFRRAIHQLHRRDYDWYLQLRRRDHLKDIAEQLNALNNALKAKDIIVADAVLALERLAAAHPHLREELESVGAGLTDVVLPLEEQGEGAEQPATPAGVGS